MSRVVTSPTKSTRKAQRLAEDLYRLIGELEAAGQVAAEIGFGGVGVYLHAAIDNVRHAEQVTTTIVKQRAAS